MTDAEQTIVPSRTVADAFAQGVSADAWDAAAFLVGGFMIVLAALWWFL